MRAALFCIFTYLDTRTLLHAAEVCRDWRFVARHPAVWTRVLLENARVCSKVPVLAPAPLLHIHVSPPLRQTIWHYQVCSWQPLGGEKTLSSLGWLRLQLRSPVPAVPDDAGAVVHPGPLADAAEPEAPAARQEGEQGGVRSEYPVRPRAPRRAGRWCFWAAADLEQSRDASQRRRWTQAPLGHPQGLPGSGAGVSAEGGRREPADPAHFPLSQHPYRPLSLAGQLLLPCPASCHLQVGTLPWKQGPQGIHGHCPAISQGSQAAGPKCWVAPGQEGVAAAEVSRWAVSALSVSAGAPQTLWAMRSSGPWVQAAERSSPSRWRHFTPGEPWLG